MAPRMVSDDELLDRLSGLFRRVGYEAATLGAIAVASGLQRSSLYHRFPGGKHQMAAEVAVHVGHEFDSKVLAPLAAVDEPIEQRLRDVGRNLIAFYNDGKLPCLLDALSLGDAGDGATNALRAAADAWVSAFASIARQAGHRRSAALVRAEDAVAGIEGGLVIARVTGDGRAFRRAVVRLPELLLAPPGRS